jgi:hypothetical protein
VLYRHPKEIFRRKYSMPLALDDILTALDADGIADLVAKSLEVDKRTGERYVRSTRELCTENNCNFHKEFSFGLKIDKVKECGPQLRDINYRYRSDGQAKREARDELFQKAFGTLLVPGGRNVIPNENINNSWRPTTAADAAKRMGRPALSFATTNPHKDVRRPTVAQDSAQTRPSAFALSVRNRIGTV